MYQPSSPQWQQPPTQYYQQPYYPPQQPLPTTKPKHSGMKTLAIVCFSIYAIGTVIAALMLSHGAGPVGAGIFGCLSILSFIAGFLFLCLI